MFTSFKGFDLIDKYQKAKKAKAKSQKSKNKKLYKILFVLAVGVPSSFQRSVLFWFVEKNPGAIAFTRIPTSAKWTAINSVKFLTAAFAAEYAGIFVSGR